MSFPLTLKKDKPENGFYIDFFSSDELGKLQPRKY
tara:strand:- start:5233 stop:5337 length:105 start_codon:yes stop_codon:yes gene_type:complete